MILVSDAANFLQMTMYNSSVLNLYRIDRKQMGTYLCIASNDVHPAVSKRVTLSVNCKSIQFCFVNCVGFILSK